MKNINLHWHIIFAMALGLGYSWLSIWLDYSAFTNAWISPFGDIFIRLLKLLAVPIVLFSIISGISSMQETKGLGRLAIRMFSLYTLTTLFAIALGMGLSNWIKPGQKTQEHILLKNRLNYEFFAHNHQIPIYGTAQWTDPKNEQIILQIKNETQNSKPLDQTVQTARQVKNKNILSYVVEIIPDNIFVALMEPKLMIQVIFFAIFFGISLLFVPKNKVSVVIDFVEGFNLVLVQMMQFVMSISPFFVFCLMAGTFSKLTQTTAGLFSIFSSLGWYAGVILLGFFLMLFFVYPLMLYIFGKQFSLTRFFTGIRAAQVVGFSTSSSVATLPISLKCVKDNLGVSTKVANFVLPIGATVNMDGTSLYQGAAVIFLAQFHGIDLSWEVQLTVLLTTLLTSIGASGIPSAGLILLIVILESIGLDPYWIAIIAPIDRLIDMLRTVVNLTGDAMVAVVLSRHEKKNILDAIF